MLARKFMGHLPETMIYQPMTGATGMRITVSLLIVLIAAVTADAQQCITTKPPKGAVVLVKGNDNSAWKAQDGSRCPWPTRDGVMTVHKMNIMTKREFGDVQQKSKISHLLWLDSTGDDSLIIKRVVPG
jgi:hypothetical protein